MPINFNLGTVRIQDLNKIKKTHMINVKQCTMTIFGVIV